MLSETQIIVAVSLMLVVATTVTLGLRSRHPGRVPLVPPQRFLAWWLILAGLVITHILGSNPQYSFVPKVIGFTILSLLALRQFFSHLGTPLTRHTKIVCYLTAVAQYYLVFIKWYGFFVVFVPVFMFLYLPVSGMAKDKSSSPLLQLGAVHWILMTAIFCLSHAAYLAVLPNGPGLLSFVVIITELADAVRMLLARAKLHPAVSPILSVLTAILVAWIIGPAFTPLSFKHTMWAGLLLGIAGSIGYANISSLRKEIGIQQGGPLERVEALAYTAPIFLHAYRYLDYPV